MRMAKLNRIVAGLVLALGGCSKETPEPFDSETGFPKEGAAISGSGPTELKERVKWVAKEYQEWGRVDDEARWAPYLCQAPPPSVARFSRSHDNAPHGRKLYFVFAQNAGHYRMLNHFDNVTLQMSKKEPSVDEMGPSYEQYEVSTFQVDDQPEIGQIIVKESWHPVETDAPPGFAEASPYDYPFPGSEIQGSRDNPNYFVPYATKGGKTYRTGQQGPLFIMMKVGEDDPTIKTDDGWVYATVEPDTKEITGLGRIESCMKCHVDAPNDRLFGLPN